MDWLTFAMAVAGGVANGTFPVFIKTPRVLTANVHPVVFQMYKSVWVFIFGLICMAVRLARGLPLAFTPWATASAVAWIPSGLFTIVAVPMIGVGSAVLTTAAFGSSLSFLVFWLALNEKVKTHQVAGHEIVLAPWYMLGILVGMAMLVAAHQCSIRAQKQKAPDSPLLADVSDEEREAAPDHAPRPTMAASERRGERANEVAAARTSLKSPPTAGSSVARLGLITLGYASAATSGVFSCLQYGLITLGHRMSGVPNGAKDERFDALGSWLLLFGASAVLCTLLAWALVAIHCRTNGRPAPSAQLRVMAIPGSCAGIFWSLANLLTTLAVLRGGNAVTLAQVNAAGLVTSGAWGLLWYREIRGWTAVAWVGAAAFTVGMSILLGFEKA